MYSFLTNMKMISFILSAYLLLLVQTATAEEKSNITNKIENYHDLFYKMSPVSEKGRYLNQSEMDFEKLLPICTCLPHANCSNQCCYCQLGCPIPDNSFTKELFVPEDISCFTNVPTRHEMQGKSRSKAVLPLFCDRNEDFHGHTSRWFNFLCVKGLGLNYFMHFFDINPGWASMSPPGSWNLIGKYNWRNNGNTESSNSIRNIYSVIDANELVVTQVNQSLGNINFTKQDNFSSQTRAFHILNPMEFEISAPVPCSQLSEGRSLEECTYFIKLVGRNCTQLRDAVVIASRVLSFIITNVTTLNHVSIAKNERANQENGSEEEWYYCESIPNYGVITEVRYRTNVVGVYARFDRFLHKDNTTTTTTTEFPMRLSFNRVFISEQVFSNLPRFWNEIMYGKCLERFCWRDLGKIGPDEASWRLSSLDNILWKNIIHCCVPILPILVYFLVHSALY